MSQTKQIEQKWQQRWEAAHLFEADPDPKREKKFVTFPFPYMNAHYMWGIHSLPAASTPTHVSNACRDITFSGLGAGTGPANPFWALRSV
jgi:hypothetical protein